MNIQKFAEFDDVKKMYEQSIKDTEAKIKNLETEKQSLINNYNTNYQNQLTGHEELQGQQQELVNTWAETSKENQQKQTDYNLDQINKSKQEQQQAMESEVGAAYVDYQKGKNEFGGNEEALYSSGLAGTGFAKNSDIALNVAYQNRISSAKSTLSKANLEYDNQMQKALLNNDFALAEIALQQLQQNYQLALQGFEYKSNLYNQKLSYETSINDNYYAKTTQAKDQIDNYRNKLTGIKQAQIELAEQRKQQATRNYQWQQEHNLNKKKLEEIEPVYKDTTGKIKTPYGMFDYNQDTLTNGQFDKNKVFSSNGYQPNNYQGSKLSKSGLIVSDVFGTGNHGSTGINVDGQNIWRSATGKYVIWDGSVNQYTDVTKDIPRVKRVATGVSSKF